ncbi:hypothetical protein [Qipengyuania atrilutea]|uniref:Lipoprotein n=1 Tax=Qipengyuania atrilutea TaxID=2744473 RepID=A0A850GV98_9SPHN|nr:hypothetical protein [Actirhodobacter atriluteus]NVD43401.1 hypothetical protein [Actirhodobacter atriluteus]
MTFTTRSLLIGCSALALAGCGADEIVSPGTGGNITINNPAPAPAPSPAPAPTPAPTVTAADGCPTISNPTALTDNGTISGPTGTYRRCTLPARFTASTSLPYIQGVLYEINGEVAVGTDGGPAADASDGLSDTDVTLTIAPGVILVSSGSSYLLVNRGNELQANGTAERPIIFTSLDNARGFNSSVNASGQWGGVVLNGRAPVTDCIAGGAATGTVQCEREVEGTLTRPRYGGATPGDSSGSLQYVQIRYSGFIVADGDELQALTTGGIGSGTTLNHIMSYNSSDDGMEFFGGVNRAKYLISVGAEDDSFDVDTGAQAYFQYVIAAQRDFGETDTIIELDDNNDLYNDTPRSYLALSNGTFIHRASSAGRAIRLRGEADATIMNSVLVGSAAPCLQFDLLDTINAAEGSQPGERGPLEFQSVVLDCTTDTRSGSGVSADQALAAFTGGGSNNNANFTTTLTMTFINGSNESGVAVFNPTAISSFFDNPAQIGAAYEGNASWVNGWTCNSSTLSFGSGNTGNCSSLPVYPS